MGRKHRMIDADEYDAFGKKNFYRWRPGQRRKIKQRYNKRIRKIAKAELCR